MSGMIARTMLAIGLAWAGTAGATTLLYTNGYVTGIDDLIIGSKIYDVNFEAGSYDSVFSGSAPTFLNNESEAINARSAITNFMASQSSLPILNGNTFSGQPYAILLTPFTVSGGQLQAATNGYDFRNPTWINFGKLVNEPVTRANEFAVYTFDRNVSAPVPELTSAAMFSLGLAGIALLRRVRRT